MHVATDVRWRRSSWCVVPPVLSGKGWSGPRRSRAGESRRTCSRPRHKTRRQEEGGRPGCAAKRSSHRRSSSKYGESCLLVKFRAPSLPYMRRLTAPLQDAQTPHVPQHAKHFPAKPLPVPTDARPRKDPHMRKLRREFSETGMFDRTKIPVLPFARLWGCARCRGHFVNLSLRGMLAPCSWNPDLHLSLTKAAVPRHLWAGKVDLPRMLLFAHVIGSLPPFADGHRAP